MANPYKIMQTRTQSQNKLVRANEKSLVRARLQIQCACVHRDGNGAINLDPPHGEKSSITGAPLYTCHECYKKIDLNSISQEEFERALNVIDRICDVSKLRLDCKTDRDRELLSNIAQFQFQLNEMVRNLYNTAVKGNNKKKKQHRGEDSSVRVSR